MKAYKGFNKDMTCRDFQYREGGEYETGKAKLCESGFHACENPLDCLNYYSPNDGCVYHEIEVSGDIEKASDDSKVAATRIKIGARLSIAGIVKGAIDFIFSKATPPRLAITATPRCEGRSLLPPCWAETARLAGRSAAGLSSPSGTTIGSSLACRPSRWTARTSRPTRGMSFAAARS